MSVKKRDGRGKGPARRTRQAGLPGMTTTGETRAIEIFNNALEMSSEERASPTMPASPMRPSTPRSAPRRRPGSCSADQSIGCDCPREVRGECCALLARSRTLPDKRKWTGRVSPKLWATGRKAVSNECSLSVRFWTPKCPRIVTFCHAVAASTGPHSDNWLNFLLFFDSRREFRFRHEWCIR